MMIAKLHAFVLDDIFTFKKRQEEVKFVEEIFDKRQKIWHHQSFFAFTVQKKWRYFVFLLDELFFRFLHTINCVIYGTVVCHLRNISQLQQQAKNRVLSWLDALSGIVSTSFLVVRTSLASNINIKQENSEILGEAAAWTSSTNC